MIYNCKLKGLSATAKRRFHELTAPAPQQKYFPLCFSLNEPEVRAVLHLSCGIKRRNESQGGTQRILGLDTPDIGQSDSLVKSNEVSYVGDINPRSVEQLIFQVDQTQPTRNN